MASPRISLCVLLIVAMVTVARSGSVLHQMLNGQHHVMHNNHLIQHELHTVHGHGHGHGHEHGHGIDTYEDIDYCLNGRYYSPDPDNCAGYLQHDDGGSTFSMPCAPATHWSQAACTCVHGECKSPKLIHIHGHGHHTSHTQVVVHHTSIHHGPLHHGLVHHGRVHHVHHADKLFKK